MTPEFVSLHPGDTVRQALDTIRRTGIHRETVYTCYVLSGGSCWAACPPWTC